MHSPTNEEIDEDALWSRAQMDYPRSSAYMERPTRNEHIDSPRSSVQLFALVVVHIRHVPTRNAPGQVSLRKEPE